MDNHKPEYDELLRLVYENNKSDVDRLIELSNIIEFCKKRISFINETEDKPLPF